MAQTKKIKVFSYAKIQAIVMAFVGLIAGVLYSGIGAIYDSVTGSLGVGTVLAFMALVGMPILFAAFGFLTGLVGVVLFNLASKWIGGIELSIEQG